MEENRGKKSAAGSRGGYSVGENVDPGLPNITGSYRPEWVWTGNQTYDGAFTESKTGKFATGNGGASGHGGFDFDASKSNSIYGASDTVQPAAHIVIYWKRIE